MELVSIVIPNYNKEKYLKACLDSVAGQTHKNLEVIIVDDASTDKSTEIINAFRMPFSETTVKIIRNTENKGTAYCRNLGLDEASGRYVAFLDSDDMLTGDSIARRMRVMQSNAEPALVGGYVYVVTEPFGFAKCEKRQFEFHIRTSKLFVPSSVLIDAHYLPQRFDESIRFNEDKEYLLRALSAGGAWAIKLTTPVAYYRNCGGHKRNIMTEKELEDAKAATDHILDVQGITARGIEVESEPLVLINYWGKE